MAEVSKKLKEALDKEGVKLTSREMEQLSALTSEGKLDDDKLEQVSGGAMSYGMKKALGIAAAIGVLTIGVTGTTYFVNKYGKTKISANSESTEEQGTEMKDFSGKTIYDAEGDEIPALSPLITSDTKIYTGGYDDAESENGIPPL